MWSFHVKTRVLVPLSVIMFLSVCVAGQEEGVTGTVISVPAGHILQISSEEKPELAVLYGVRCPETLTLLGKKAKAFTAGRVLDQAVEIRVVEHKWGLAHVSVRLPDGNDLGELLLAEGLARWDQAVAPASEKFKALESQAKERGVGLWSKPRGPYVAPGLRSSEPGHVRTSRQNDETTLETSLDEKGVVRLVGRGNYEKGDHNFEETVVQQRNAEYDRRMAELRRQREALLREQERQLYMEGADYEYWEGPPEFWEEPPGFWEGSPEFWEEPPGFRY